MNPPLHIQVKGRNELNALINQIVPALHKVIAEFKGQMFKANGAPTVAFEKVIPAFSMPLHGQWFFNPSRYSVTVCFRHFVTDKEKQLTHCFEETVYLLDLVHTPAKPYTFEPFKADFKVEEIDATQKQIKELETQISNLKQTIPYFLK